MDIALLLTGKGTSTLEVSVAGALVVAVMTVIAKLRGGE